MPIGHRRLLINEVNKIRSPHSKSLLTAIDSQELQTAGTESLWPKELFPHDHSDSSGTLDTVAWEKLDPRIEEYQYSSPMEKHLNCILNDVEMKENDITKLRSELESMSSHLDDDDAVNSQPCCSQCHEWGHKKNKCTGAKCLTSISYGCMRLHKDEMKTIDTSKSNLKKLLKEKSTLEIECDHIRGCVCTNNRSFPQAVRSHLINSNKCKYLTMYGDNVVPLTKVINLDLSILQKFYESRVPPNLDEESQRFESINFAHTSKFKSSNTSINTKIIDNVRKIDS